MSAGVVRPGIFRARSILDNLSTIDASGFSYTKWCLLSARMVRYDGYATVPIGLRVQPALSLGFITC